MPPRKKAPELCGYRLQVGGVYASVCGGAHSTELHEKDVERRRTEGFEEVDVDDLESKLIEYTARDLAAMGKLETMLGQQLLAIARGIVRGSGSELATLSKEHSRLMAAIAAGQTVASDPMEATDDAVAEKRRRAAEAAKGGG